MEARFLQRATKESGIFFGSNILKRERAERKQGKRNLKLDCHIILSNDGIIRRKAGSKLGLRKRLRLT